MAPTQVTESMAKSDLEQLWSIVLILLSAIPTPTILILSVLVSTWFLADKYVEPFLKTYPLGFAFVAALTVTVPLIVIIYYRSFCMASFKKLLFPPSNASTAQFDKGFEAGAASQEKALVEKEELLRAAIAAEKAATERMLEIRNDAELDRHQFAAIQLENWKLKEELGRAAATVIPLDTSLKATEEALLESKKSLQSAQGTIRELQRTNDTQFRAIYKRNKDVTSLQVQVADLRKENGRLQSTVTAHNPNFFQDQAKAAYLDDEIRRVTSRSQRLEEEYRGFQEQVEKDILAAEPQTHLATRLASINREQARAAKAEEALQSAERQICRLEKQIKDLSATPTPRSPEEQSPAPLTPIRKFGITKTGTTSVRKEVASARIRLGAQREEMSVQQATIAELRNLLQAEVEARGGAEKRASLLAQKLKKVSKSAQRELGVAKEQTGTQLVEQNRQEDVKGSAEAEIRRLKEFSAGLQSQLEESQQKMSTMAKDIERLEVTRADLEFDVDSLKDDLRVAGETAAKQLQALQDLHQKGEDKVDPTKMEEVEGSLPVRSVDEDLTMEVDNASPLHDQSLETLQAQLQSSERMLAEQTAENARLQLLGQQLEQEHLKASSEHKVDSETLSKAQNDLQATRTECDNLRKIIQTGQQQLDELTQQLAHARQEVETAKSSQVAPQNDILQTLRDSCDKKDKHISKLEEALHRAKYEPQMAKEGSFSGVQSASDKADQMQAELVVKNRELADLAAQVKQLKTQLGTEMDRSQLLAAQVGNQAGTTAQSISAAQLDLLKGNLARQAKYRAEADAKIEALQKKVARMDTLEAQLDNAVAKVNDLEASSKLDKETIKDLEIMLELNGWKLVVPEGTDPTSDQHKLLELRHDLFQAKKKKIEATKQLVDQRRECQRQLAKIELLEEELAKARGGIQSGEEEDEEDEDERPTRIEVDDLEDPAQYESEESEEECEKGVTTQR